MSDERKPMANIAPFGLRMQPDLKARVETAAKENNRSLNAEIVARLEASLSDYEEYNVLLDAALASMEKNAEDARREVHEYKVMTSQIRLLRHLLSRIYHERDSIPSEIESMIETLFLAGENADAGDDDITLELLEKARDALISEEQAKAAQGSRKALEAESRRDEAIARARKIAQELRAKK